MSLGKRYLAKIGVLMLVSSLAGSQAVRQPVWDGQFYPEDPDRLAHMIDDLVRQADVSAFTPENLKALIVPHAGYVYSGKIAAHAYRLVQGESYDTIVIVGTAHRTAFSGCSLFLKGGYQTPLGLAAVDTALAQELARVSGFGYIPAAHSREHSIEVQIPFIQRVLPGAKIVPILMGSPSEKTAQTLAQALRQVLAGKNALVVVSTDMSHYFPKGEANARDKDTIRLITSLDTARLLERLERGENIMCGGGGVVAALFYAQSLGQAEVKILRYADSSEAGGPRKQVVGYLAAAFHSTENSQAFSLSPSEKKELLELARGSITAFVTERRLSAYTPQNPGLLTKKGAFVTLKKRGALRGCIGFIEPVAPLYQAVIQAAVFAASRDVRFRPVTPDELDALEIEISVLSAPRSITDPDKIQVGKHGLIIAQGERRGLLLPQVPVENRWARRTFLQQACLKAGLPKDAWKSGAEIFVFEALVFHESDAR